MSTTPRCGEGFSLEHRKADFKPLPGCKTDFFLRFLLNMKYLRHESAALQD
jgi:hypothetical protein